MPTYYSPVVLTPGQVFRDSTIYCDHPTTAALTLADNCRVENVTIRKTPVGARKSWTGVGIYGAGVENATLENLTITGHGTGIAIDGNPARDGTGRISIEKTFIDANQGVFIRKITDNVWLEKVHVHPMLGVIGDGASTNYLYTSKPAFYISDRAETVNMVGCHSYGHPQGILIDNPTPEYAPSVRVSNFNAESYPDPNTALGFGLPANSAGIAAMGECSLNVDGLFTYSMESCLVVDFAINPWGCNATIYNSSPQVCYGAAFDLRRGEGAIYGVMGDKYQGNTVIRRAAGTNFDVAQLRYVRLV